VLGRSGSPINSTAGLGPTPDEHSSVFAPGTLGTNQDDLFFLATGTAGNAGIGVTVTNRIPMGGVFGDASLYFAGQMSRDSQEKTAA